MADFTTETAAVRAKVIQFATRIRQMSEDAATAQHALNSDKLEGLTLNEVVELIAATVGLTIQEVQDSLDAFIARRDNPHVVTKEQVGLGLVDNFSTATDAEAAGLGYRYVATDGQTAFTGTDADGGTLELQDGAIVYLEKNSNRLLETAYTFDVPTDTVTLATPATSDTYTYTATADQTAFTGADDAAATMALSNGQRVAVTRNGTTLTAGTDYTVNYSTNTITLTTPATAGDTIAVTASDIVVIRIVTTNRFMTPEVLWHVMDAFWGQKVGSAPATLDTIAELAAALENNPDVIDNLITQIGTKATQADIDATVGALTKADVGLDLVENYAPATNTDATTGTSTTTYMTPASTKAATDVLYADLQGQIQAASDSVTKENVGLGLVENYPPASDAEALAGTATDRYMTPANTNAVRVDIDGNVSAAWTALEAAFTAAITELDNTSGTPTT